MKYRCHSRSPSPSSRTDTYASTVNEMNGMNPIEAIAFMLGACTFNIQQCVFSDSPTAAFSPSRKRSKTRSKQWKADFDDDDDGTEVTAGSSTSSKALRTATKIRKCHSSRSNSRSRSRSRLRDISPRGRSRSKSRSRTSSRRSSFNRKGDTGRSPGKLNRSRSRSAGRNSHRSPVRSSKRFPRSSKSARSRTKRSGETQGPSPVRLNTEIEVRLDCENPDDDVSAISAGTLEDIVAKQERIAILNYANEQLKKKQSSTDQAATPHLQHNFTPKSANLEASSRRENTIYSFDKENVINMSSDVSHASISAASSGTSEFDSVWRNPQKSSSRSSCEKAYKTLDEYQSSRFNADNNHYSAEKKLSTSEALSTGRRGMEFSTAMSSRRFSKWETPNSRKLRRQIQRDGIGAIPENDGMSEVDFETDRFEDADALNNNTLLPDEEEI